MTTVATIHLGPDDHASLPAAASVAAGSLYSCTDHNKIYKSDGSTWNDYATLGGGGAHATSHEDGGADEIDVSGLSGVLDDPQPTTIAQITDATAYAKTLLDDTDAATARATLGLVIGTNVQAQDAELAAIAGLTSAADKGIQFTGSGTAATYDLTTAGKALLDDANAAAQRTTLGLGTVATLDSDTDGTLAANSDAKVATQKAVKTYVDANVGGSSDMVRLATLPASASATLEFTGITSDYDAYLFHFIGIVPGTTGTSLWMRAMTGGTPAADTGSVYSVDQFAWRAGGSGLGGGTSQTKIALMLSTQATTSNWSLSGHCWLYNPNSASLYKHVIGEVRLFDGSVRASNQYSGSYESTTAMTGVQFLMSNGNIGSGKIICYGLKNA